MQILMKTIVKPAIMFNIIRIFNFIYNQCSSDSILVPMPWQCHNSFQFKNNDLLFLFAMLVVATGCDIWSCLFLSSFFFLLFLSFFCFDLLATSVFHMPTDGLTLGQFIRYGNFRHHQHNVAKPSCSTSENDCHFTLTCSKWIATNKRVDGIYSLIHAHLLPTQVRIQLFMHSTK